MINEESRKYFQRAFSISGSAMQSYVLWTYDREEQLQSCTKTNDKNKMIEYLKTANSSMVLECSKPGWYLTIESPILKNAFLTQWPEEIFKTEVPIMDAMFSFGSKVKQYKSIDFLPFQIIFICPGSNTMAKECNYRFRTID